MKRMLSFLMAVAMVLSILPLPALAAEGCANHPAHDASCGYVAAVESQPCNHQHSEECRVETVNCTHVHTAECYPEGDMDGEPSLCEHVCSVESGCVTVSCNHVHDGECGYVDAVAGQPCGHSCDLCNPPEEPEKEMVCICDTRCNEMVNTDCPVCAVDASQCAVPEASNDLPPVPQAVLDVQAMIDALPTLDEVKAITDEESWYAVYDQAYAAYEAYLELSEEEIALVDASHAEELLVYFRDTSIEFFPANVPYIDGTGANRTAASCTSVKSQTTWNAGWYVVDSNVTISSRITINGNVSLILADGYTLDASKGIQVPEGSYFTIYGQSAGSGTLKATGDYWGKQSGIGSNAYEAGGKIAINGGTLIAKAGVNAAAIGTGDGGGIQAIYINGGTIQADGNSGYVAAVIGAGAHASCGSIIINGGNITTGDCNGHKIGHGDYSTCDLLSIGPDAVLKNRDGSYPKISTDVRSLYVAISAVALDKTSLILKQKETVTLTATVIPSAATVPKYVTWYSSNLAVATVDLTGKITAVAPGTATIKATAGTKSATCIVTVPYPVTGVELDVTEVTMDADDTLQLTATVSPSNAGNKNVAWISSDDTVAEVDENGLVTAVDKGTATITAKTEDGGFEATCTVTVTVNREPVDYLDAAGETQTTTDYTPVQAGKTAWKSGWYVVSSDVTIEKRITTRGDVHLILTDGCHLNAQKGITVAEGNSLTIYCQSKGESVGALTSTGSYGGAGIGGYDGPDGTITINGGTVTATGGAFGAGIGGGDGSSGGKIIINGGAVQATGGDTAPGIGGGGAAVIGGGGGGPCGEITINGGTITAVGSIWAAGIGGGYRSSGGKIIISGGTVNATQGEAAWNDIGPGGAGSPADYIYIHREPNLVNNNGSYPSVGAVVEGGTRVIETKTLTMSSETLTKNITDDSFALSVTAYPSITTEVPVWASSDESVATVDENGQVTIVGVGTADITASVTDTDANPEIIIKATCALTVRADSELALIVKNGSEVTSTFTYGDTITVEFTPEVKAATRLAAPALNQAALFLGDTPLTGSVTAEENGKFTLTYNTADKGIPIGAGQTLTVQYGGSATLNGGTEDVTVTLNKKPLNVTLADTTTKVYDGGTTCNGTGLTLTVEGVLPSDAVTHAVAYTYDEANAGNRTVTASITLGGTDKGYYALPETPVTVAGTITAKPVTLTWSATNFVYTGTSQAPTATAGNLAGADTCTVTVTGAQTDTGTYMATASALSNGNYQLPEVTTTSFTISPKTVNEPIIELSETSFVYDGTEKKPTVIVMDGETVIDPAEYSVAYAKNTDVGTATVTIEDIPGGNYAVSGSATFQITTSGTNGGVVLDHTNNTYIYGESVGVTVTVQPTGEAPSLLTAFVNLLTGNDNTVSIYQGNTRLAGPTEVEAGKAVFTLDSVELGVGTWNLEARFSGSDNMAADTQPFQVIVNQKELTVTGVKAAERFYEPNNMTVTLDLNNAQLAGLVGEDEVTVSSGTGTILTDSAAENKPVTVTGLTLGGKDVGNYTLKQPVGLTVTIKQVTVTITANDATAKTGEEKPTAFGYSVDGLLGEDQLTTPPTFTCDADMTKAGTYDIVPSGAEVNSNYTLAYINGTLTVQQSTTPIVPGDTVRYIVEHYKGNTLADKEVLGGKIGETVTAVDKNYEGYRVNTDKSTMSGTLVKLEKPEDIVILKVYYDLKVNGVSLNETTLTLTEGNTETLIATVTPEGAVNKVVTWSSSNTDVATVDANGKVTAVKEGKATITVTTADGGFKAECEVTVKPATYTVTFDSNGGSAVAAQTVENGKKAAKPADPTLAKHNFKGWYTDEECTKPYDFGAPVTADLTLHAKWAEVYTFTLEYKANTSATVRSMPKDETVTSERDEMAFRLSYSKPKRSGYTFTGWNTQSNGKGKKYQPGDDVPGIKDGTVPLYAQWKQNSGSWWDNPKTGDYILIAVAVLAVSGIALAGLLVYAKKKKK